jgi:RND family efflux transporter MFP subunit
MSNTENRTLVFRKVILSIVLVACIGATAFAAWWYLSPRPSPPPARAPITVAAQRAERLAWPSHLSGVGDLTAVQGIEVTSEVAGVITTIAFQPGQDVDKGALLIQLDDTIDKARLAALKAQEKLAQLRFERQKALARRDIASEATLDEATAELQRLRAEIDVQEEAIAEKAIKAPFSGRLGIRQVSLGQYVQPGQPLVTLQNLDTLYANFALPEQAYPRVEEGQTITVHIASYPEQSFAGKITAINPRIAPSTRHFTVQGVLRNQERLLRPGMFAEVTVQLGQTRQVVALPASAISYNPYGDAVFVLQLASDSRGDEDEGSHGEDNGSKEVFVANIQSDLHFDRKQVKVHIDRDRAADLGIDMGQLAEALATMLSEAHVNYFSLQGYSYEVIPRVDDSFRRDPEQLLDFQIRTEEGALIPASTFVSLEQETVPRQLNRFEQLNAAVLSGVPAPGVTTGDALSFLAEEARALFPNDFRSDYAGLSRQFVQESGALLIAFGLAIVLIYLVLAAQFESFRDPLIMLITVPMSTVGALAFIVIAGASINIYTQIGLITLIGAISKHGILIVEYARQVQLNEGLDRRAAVEKAAQIRLRPILMTTLATGAALVPLLLASGPGAEARFATSLVPAAGMFFGTLFTLFVLPAFYTVIASERKAKQLDGVVKPERQAVS